jgi:hypothetical protein
MTTSIPENVIGLAAKLYEAGWEVKVAGQLFSGDEMTDEDRDLIASSIANEADPAERKRLTRELLESGLAATQRGQELAREVLKAAGRLEIADVAVAQGQ